MAKTTRKTETTTGEIKPAARRKAAAPGDGAEKVTTRRRTKTPTDGPEASATANSRPARSERPAQGALAAEPTHEEIALRAWTIYQRRGGAHGKAMSDWLQAKAELMAERRSKA